MKLGALDYLTKPFGPEALALTWRERDSNDRPSALPSTGARIHRVGVFFRAAMAGLETQLQRILPPTSGFMAQERRRLRSGQGETGTGKTTHCAMDSQ